MLTGVFFNHVDLRGVSFEGADLHHADFLDCTLTGARFDRAELDSAVFTELTLGAVEMPDTRLRAADLGRVVMWESDLDGSDLSGAFVDGAFISGTTLNGITIDGADFSDATFDDVELRGIDGNEGLGRPPVFRGARVWSSDWSDNKLGAPQQQIGAAITWLRSGRPPMPWGGGAERRRPAVGTVIDGGVGGQRARHVAAFRVRRKLSRPNGTDNASRFRIVR